MNFGKEKETKKKENEKEKKERYQISLALCIAERKISKSIDRKGNIHYYDDIKDYNNVLRYEREDEKIKVKMYDDENLKEVKEVDNKSLFSWVGKVLDKIEEEVFDEITELNTKAFDSLKIIKYLEEKNIEYEDKEITTSESNFANIDTYYVDYDIVVSLTQNQLKEIKERFEYDNMRIYKL